MSMFNKLRDYLFKEAAGEELGQRIELLITLTLAVLSILLSLLLYQRNPITLIAAAITSVTGLYTLYHAFRSQYKYVNIFLVLASISICIFTIFEGKGTHDLLWVGNLGLFLLATVQNRKSLLFPIFLAIAMIGVFAATGIAEISGLLDNPYDTTAQDIYLNSSLFAAIMLAIVAIFHRHYSVLRIAAESKTAQINSNQSLKEINQTLENRVELRTRELSEANKQMRERATRLQIISEISQEISSNIEQQLSGLLDRTVRIISERLDYYHVGIFLLDENREYAVLRAANSQGGQRMLSRRHQLKVGGTGIVGYVSQGGRTRIALDTGSDAIFFGNPDLPKTRSEMALPLKYGSQVIGVLDLQSTMPSAFKEEDANLIGTLANQIAIAINNVLVNEQSRLDDPYRTVKLSRKMGSEQRRSGFSYNSDGTISTSEAVTDPVMEKVLASGEIIQVQPSKNAPPVLAVPVKFRDQVIGIIHIEATEADRKWTEDEITVVQSISDRAAFALENARLLEQTRRRAEQEETVAHITSQIGASTNFSHILQTTVEELGRTLGATRTFIQLDTSPDDNTVEHKSVTD
jgi:GAF domain-containing protein